MAEQEEECGQGGKGDEDWLSPESDGVDLTRRRGVTDLWRSISDL